MFLELFMYITNFIGIVAFAITGFLKAQKYNLDIFGAIILGVVTSVAGGITRDLLLNNRPLIFENHHDMILAIIVVLVMTFYFKVKNFNHKFFSKYKDKMMKIVLILDAIGISAFTIIGSQVAMKYTNSMINIAIFAMITSVAGGVYRDLFVREIPFIFKEDVYAILCLMGSSIYVELIRMGYNIIFSTILVFVSMFLVRLIIIEYKINLPVINNKNDNKE